MSEARTDLRVLWIGIPLSLALTALIWLLGPRLAEVPHPVDTGPSLYLWQTPEPTFGARASAWGFYLAHNLSLFALLFVAQRQRPRWSGRLHPVNLALLGANALFVALHFVQTHVWYDGIAIDVSIWSSLGSVAVLLIWVLLLENQRRGLFFGKRVPLPVGVREAARRYHGYYFAWAITYTFWYHPMESTRGHLLGFAYMFLLLLQTSTPFTKVHTHKWWTLALEVFVVFHGAMVALEQGNALWPMFFFGFLGVFVITQMHGLGLSRATRGALGALYLAGVVATTIAYGPMILTAVPRIPVIDYLGAALLAGVLAALAAATGLRRRAAPRPTDPRPTGTSR